MRVNIKGHDIELQYCMRMYIKYEERTKESMTYLKAGSFSSMIELLYCAITAALENKKYRDLNLSLTWEEFLDWTDDQHPTLITNDFSNWLNEATKVQSEFINNKDKEGQSESDPN